jgi:hypothetical protein
MEDFTCARCGYVATTKGNLKRHLKNKKTCLPRNSRVERSLLLQPFEREHIGDTVVCKTCTKTVSKTNFARHRNVCQGSKSQPKTANVQQQIVSEQEKHKDALSNIEEENTSNDSIVVDETKDSNINNEPINVVDEVETAQDTRQLTNKRKKYKLSKTIRQLVWKQYVGMQIGETLCVCCKSNTINCFDFQCGHIVARANGGNDTVDNMRPICLTCNGSMGTMNMRDFAERVCKVKIT